MISDLLKEKKRTDSLQFNNHVPVNFKSDIFSPLKEKEMLNKIDGVHLLLFGIAF